MIAWIVVGLLAVTVVWTARSLVRLEGELLASYQAELDEERRRTAELEAQLEEAREAARLVDPYRTPADVPDLQERDTVPRLEAAGSSRGTVRASMIAAALGGSMAHLEYVLRRRRRERQRELEDLAELDHGPPEDWS